nr:uncharacterized protein I203_06340 [Kwoniella mangroviensis CBS 8507]OCF64607.1 hypothetical protein I203_06340 [Kwoniella mangroviensis CBS 8507]
MIPQLLLRNPQALVTIIVPIAHSIPAQHELGKNGMEGDKRIIIIHYGEEDEVRKQFAVTGMEELSKFMEMLQDAVINLYPKKLKCQPIYDPLLKRDITLHPIPPTLAFLDISVACTRGVVRLGENKDYIELPGYPPFCE